MDKRQQYSESKGNFQSTQSSKSVLSTVSSSANWNYASTDQQSNEIFQQLQELNKDVDTTAQFVCGVNDIICASIPANALLILIGCFALTCILLGVSYLQDCPAEPKIPIFMFVWGCFGLLKIIHVLYTNYKLRRHSFVDVISESSQRTVEIVDGGLNIFLLVWQVLGTYWTLRIWYPYFDPPLYEPNNWCEEGLYISTLVEIVLAVIITVSRICCHVGLAICHMYTHFFERQQMEP